jgi:hypothetical protein
MNWNNIFRAVYRRYAASGTRVEGNKIRFGQSAIVLNVNEAGVGEFIWTSAWIDVKGMFRHFVAVCRDNTNYVTYILGDESDVLARIKYENIEEKDGVE